jgi:hypothetical protein
MMAAIDVSKFKVVNARDKKSIGARFAEADGSGRGQH